MITDEIKTAEELFKEFKEHSITEFFRKNSQMLGYSGKVRSLTTSGK
jgi:DNA topoisomerase-6 subunit B